MAGNILLTTAYLPPVEYFTAISGSDGILVEVEENYIKQTYRNRCYILSTHGPQLLSVPVYAGSIHKTSVKDVRIDYSKRWQQVHLRAMKTSYSSSPYFEFYFEEIEAIILKNHSFILDLNMELLASALKVLNVTKRIGLTDHFENVNDNINDFRYRIAPKLETLFEPKPYSQVFNLSGTFIPRLSIFDLIFNMGPESGRFL
jgi:hypothetical protein